MASWRVAKAFREVCRRHTALDSPRLWRADLSAPCRGIGWLEGTLLRLQTVRRTFGTRCVGVTLTPPTTRTAHSLALESRGLSIDMCLRHTHIPLELLLFQNFRQVTPLQFSSLFGAFPSANSPEQRLFQCFRHAASAVTTMNQYIN